MQFVKNPFNFIILILAMSVGAIVIGNVLAPPTTYAQHGKGGSYSNTFVTHVYEEVAGANGVVKVITAGIINTTGLEKTQRAYISFSGQAVRFVADGSTPSSAVGIPVPSGGSIELVSLEDIQNFKFINDDDVGSAVAHISLQYEKEMK